MAKFEKLEDLGIWLQARELAQIIWTLTRPQKWEQDWELRKQVNKSAGSMMDNIAEGFGRGGKWEFIQFLRISKGSQEEAKSQIIRAYDRSWISEEEWKDLNKRFENLGRGTKRLIDYLIKTENRGTNYPDQIKVRK